MLDTSHDTPLVLIIDDDPTNRLVIDRILSSAGFATAKAESGPQGRKIAQEHSPDIILLDIMMPDESGFETLRQLKANPRTASIPVIFLSALEDVGSKVQGFELGAVDYVTKPFEPLEVLARIRTNLKVVQAYRVVIAEQAARLSQVGEAQQAMLTKPEEHPEANFAVLYEPILEAGGDYYDAFPVSGGFGYVVADISGHDLRASFITSGFKALLRQNTGPLFTPTETLGNINNVLHQVLPAGKYLTVSYVLLNKKRDMLSVLSAGHPPPVFLAASGEVQVLHAEGDILGPFAHISLTPTVRSVAKGDRVFLYSDGLLDMAKPDTSTPEADMERLISACRDSRNLPLNQCPWQIFHQLSSGAKLKDDIVLLAIEV